MSVVALPFAFRVGRASGRPGVLPLDFAFRVGRGSGRPATLPFNFAFRVNGTGRPNALSMDLSFAVKAADPDEFMYDGEAWLAVAHHVWTDEGWFPPL